MFGLQPQQLHCWQLLIGSSHLRDDMSSALAPPTGATQSQEKDVEEVINVGSGLTKLSVLEH